MEYLKPIEVLTQTIKRYQVGLLCLFVLLGVSMIVVPEMTRRGNPLIIQTDVGGQLAQASPWKLSETRMELFTRAYLSRRFEWTPESFVKQKDKLKIIVANNVFGKLRESFVAFESLAQNQGAKSFYILEDWGFANAKKIIEAKIIRVLRINDVTVATPLTIQINYDEAAVSEPDPYGLTVTAVREIQDGAGVGVGK